MTETLFYADRSQRGRLRFTGRDRQTFLQGMVTNDVAALVPGGGCYAFMLDPTAHVLSDLRVVCRDSDLLVDVEPGQAAFVADTLEQYLIMEKCAVADVTPVTAQFFVGGVPALELLGSWGITDAAAWSQAQSTFASWPTHN